MVYGEDGYATSKSHTFELLAPQEVQVRKRAVLEGVNIAFRLIEKWKVHMVMVRGHVRVRVRVRVRVKSEGEGEGA